MTAVEILSLGLLAPALGRAGGGEGPFPHGKGWGMGGVSKPPMQCASIPAHRVKIPPQVPSPAEGGLWGDRGGSPGARAASCIRAPKHRSRCASSPGAAAATQATDRTLGAAAPRLACHQAKRLARQSSRPEHSSDFAARLRAWRVGEDDEVAGARRAQPEHVGHVVKRARSRAA